MYTIAQAILGPAKPAPEDINIVRQGAGVVWFALGSASMIFAVTGFTLQAGAQSHWLGLFGAVGLVAYACTKWVPDRYLMVSDLVCRLFSWATLACSLLFAGHDDYRIWWLPVFVLNLVFPTLTFTRTQLLLAGLGALASSFVVVWASDPDPLEWSSWALVAWTGFVLTVVLRISTVGRWRAVDQLALLASRDMQTGLYNRRSFGVRARDRHADTDVCVLIIDLDHFKQVNDTYGHPVGDEVLAAVGQLLSGLVRDDDLAGRWGGEEFVVALGATSSRDPVGFAERVRLGMRSLSPLPITASVGIARGQSLDDAIMRADVAMYRAKGLGRDRVIVADPHRHPKGGDDATR